MHISGHEIVHMATEVGDQRVTFEKGAHRLVKLAAFPDDTKRGIGFLRILQSTRQSSGCDIEVEKIGDAYETTKKTGGLSVFSKHPKYWKTPEDVFGDKKAQELKSEILKNPRANGVVKGPKDDWYNAFFCYSTGAQSELPPKLKIKWNYLGQDLYHGTIYPTSKVNIKAVVEAECIHLDTEGRGEGFFDTEPDISKCGWELCDQPVVLMVIRRMKAKGENKEESNRDEEYFQRVILALSNISNAPCYDFDSLKADTLLEKIDERQIGCMFEEYLQKHFFEKDLSFIAVALDRYGSMMDVNSPDYEDLMDAMNLVDQIKKVSELGKEDSTKPEESTESVQDCTHDLLSQTHLSSERKISNSGKRESRLQLQQTISTATIRNAKRKLETPLQQLVTLHR